MSSAKGRDPVRRSFASAFAFGSANFATNAIVSLVSAVVTARLYGADSIGQYALSYAPTGAVWYLSSVQEQPALVRKLATLQPKAPRVTALWIGVLTFSQVLTVVVALLAAGISAVVLSGPLHHADLVAPALTALAGYVILANPGWNMDTVLASFRAAPELFAVRFHQAAMFVVAAIGLSFFTKSVWGLILALVISYGTALVHRMIVVRRFLTARVSRSELREGFASLPEILRFGVRVMPGTLASGVSNEAGTWILGAVAPIGVVGAWSRAGNISRRLSDMNSRIADLLLPTLVERQASGDSAGVDRAVVDSMRYIAVTLLLPAAVAGGAAASVITLLFGHGYSGADGALPFLLLVPVILGINLFGSQALLAFNRPLTTTVLETTRMIITVGLGIVLSIAFHSTGMGAAMALGCALESAAIIVLIRGQLSSPMRTLWPARAMVALLLSYGSGFIVAHYVAAAIHHLWGAPVALLMGGATYVAVIALLGGILDRDRDRLRSMLALRRARLA